MLISRGLRDAVSTKVSWSHECIRPHVQDTSTPRPPRSKSRFENSVILNYKRFTIEKYENYLEKTEYLREEFNKLGWNDNKKKKEWKIVVFFIFMSNEY